MGLTFEMKGMCILVYGLMSLISTWVLMFLRSSATQSTSSDTKQREALKTALVLRVDWSHVHTHPLCALWWTDRPLCYCDLFSRFFQIQWCHCSGRRWKKNTQCGFIVDIVSLRASQQLSTRKLSNAKQHIQVYENTILTAVLGVFLVSRWYGLNY